MSRIRVPDSWLWSYDDELAFYPRNMLETDKFSQLFSQILNRISPDAPEIKGVRSELDLRAAAAESMIKFQSEHAEALPKDPSIKTSPESLYAAHFADSFGDTGEFLGKNLCSRFSTNSTLDLSVGRLKLLVKAQISGERRFEKLASSAARSTGNKCDSLIKALDSAREARKLADSKPAQKEEYKFRLLPLIVDELLDTIYTLQKPGGSDPTTLAAFVGSLVQISQNFQENDAIPSTNSAVLNCIGRLVTALQGLYDGIKLSSEQVRVVLGLMGKLSVLGRLLGWQFWVLTQILKTGNLPILEDAFTGLRYTTWESSCKSKTFPLFYKKIERLVPLPAICPNGKFKEVRLLSNQGLLYAQHESKITVLEVDQATSQYKIKFQTANEGLQNCRFITISNTVWLVDKENLIPIKLSPRFDFKASSEKMALKLPATESEQASSYLSKVVKSVGDCVKNPESVMFVENSPIPGTVIRILHCESIPAADDPGKLTTKQSYRLLQYIAVDPKSLESPQLKLKIISQQLLKPFHAGEPGKNLAYFTNRIVERYTFIGPKHFASISKTQSVEIFDLITGKSVCQPFQIHEFTSKINFDWAAQQILIMESDNQLAKFDYTNLTEFMADLDLNLCHKDGKNASEVTKMAGSANQKTEGGSEMQTETADQADKAILELGLIEDSMVGANSSNSSTPVPAWTQAKDSESQLAAIQVCYSAEPTWNTSGKVDPNDAFLVFPEVPHANAVLRQVLDCFLVNALASPRVASTADDGDLGEFAKELLANKGRYDLSADTIAKLVALLPQVFAVHDPLSANSMLKLLEVYLVDIAALQYTESTSGLASQETLFEVSKALFMLSHHTKLFKDPALIIELTKVFPIVRFSPVETQYQKTFFSVCSSLLKLRSDCRVFPWISLIDCIFSQTDQHAYSNLDTILRRMIKQIPKDSDTVTWNSAAFRILQDRCVDLINASQFSEVELLKAYSSVYHPSLRPGVSLSKIQANNLSNILMIMSRLSIHYQKESFKSHIFQAAYQASSSFLKALTVCLRKNPAPEVDAFIWSETVLGSLFYRTLILSLYDDQRATHEDTLELVENFMEIAEKIPSSISWAEEESVITTVNLEIESSTTPIHRRGIAQRVQSDQYSHLVVECTDQNAYLDTIGIFTIHETDNWNCEKDQPKEIKTCLPYKILPPGCSITIPSNDICIAIVSDSIQTETKRNIQVQVRGKNKASLDEKLGLRVLYRICNHESSKRLFETLLSKEKAFQNTLDSRYAPADSKLLEEQLQSTLFHSHGISVQSLTSISTKLQTLSKSKLPKPIEEEITEKGADKPAPADRTEELRLLLATSVCDTAVKQILRDPDHEQLFMEITEKLQTQLEKRNPNSKVLGSTGTKICQSALLLLLKNQLVSEEALVQYLTSTTSETLLADLSPIWVTLCQLRIECRNKYSEAELLEFFTKISCISVQNKSTSVVTLPLEKLADSLLGWIRSQIKVSQLAEFLKLKETLLFDLADPVARLLSSTDDPFMAGSLLQQIFKKDKHGLLPLGQEFAGVSLALEKRWASTLLEVVLDVLQSLVETKPDKVSKLKLQTALKDCCWQFTSDQADAILKVISLEKLYIAHQQTFDSCEESMQILIKFASTLATAVQRSQDLERWFSDRINTVFSRIAPAKQSAEPNSEGEVAKPTKTIPAMKDTDWISWQDKHRHDPHAELSFWQECQTRLNFHLLARSDDRKVLQEGFDLFPEFTTASRIISAQPEPADSLECRSLRTKYLINVPTSIKAAKAKSVNSSPDSVKAHSAGQAPSPQQGTKVEAADDDNCFGGLFDDVPEATQKLETTEGATNKSSDQAKTDFPTAFTASWEISTLSSLLRYSPKHSDLISHTFPYKPLAETPEKTIQLLQTHYYSSLFSSRRAIEAGRWRFSEVHSLRNHELGLKALSQIIEADHSDSVVGLVLEVADTTPQIPSAGDKVKICGDISQDQFIILPRNEAKDNLQYVQSLPLILQDVTSKLPFRKNPSQLDTINGYQLLMCLRTGTLKYVSRQRIEAVVSPPLEASKVELLFSKHTLDAVVEQADISNLGGLFKLWKVSRILANSGTDQSDHLVAKIQAKLTQSLPANDHVSRVPVHIADRELAGYVDLVSASVKSLSGIPSHFSSQLAPAEASSKFKALRSKIYRAQTAKPQDSELVQRDFNTLHYPEQAESFAPEFLLGLSGHEDIPSAHVVARLFAAATLHYCRQYLLNPLRAPRSADAFVREVVPLLKSPHEEALCLLEDKIDVQRQTAQTLMKMAGDSSDHLAQDKYLRLSRILVKVASRDLKDPASVSLRRELAYVLVRVGLNALSHGIKQIQNNHQLFQLFMATATSLAEYAPFLEGKQLDAQTAKAYQSALALIINRDSLSPLSVSKFRGVEPFTPIVFYFCRKIAQHTKIDHSSLDETSSQIHRWLELKNQHFQEAASPLTDFEDVSVKGILVRSLRTCKSDEQNPWKLEFTPHQRTVNADFLKDYPKWMLIAQDTIDNCKNFSLGLYTQDASNPTTRSWLRGVNLDRTNTPALSIATRFNTPADVVSGAAKTIATTEYTQDFVSTPEMTQFDTPLLNRRDRDFTGAWGGSHYFVVDNNVHYTEKDASIVDTTAVLLWKDNKSAVYYKKETKQLVISLTDTIHDAGLQYRSLLDSDRTLNFYYIDCAEFPEIIEGLFVCDSAAALVRDIHGRLLLLDPDRTQLERSPPNFTSPEEDTKGNTASALRNGLYFIFQDSEPKSWQGLEILIPNPESLFKLTHVSDPDRNNILVFGLQSSTDSRIVVWEDQQKHATVLEFKDLKIQRIITYSDYLAVLFTNGTVYSAEDMSKLATKPTDRVEYIQNPPLNTKLGKISDIILIYRSSIVGIEEVNHELEKASLGETEAAYYSQWTTSGKLMRFKNILGSNFNPPYELEGLITSETRFMENSSTDSRQVMLKHTRTVRNIACRDGQFAKATTLSTPSVIGFKDSEIRVTIPIDKKAELELVGTLLKTPLTFVLLNLFHGGVGKSEYTQYLKEYADSSLWVATEGADNPDKLPPADAVACVWSFHPDYAANPTPGLIWLQTIPERLLDLENTIKDPLLLIIPDEKGFRKGLPDFLKKVTANGAQVNFDQNLRVHLLPDFDQMTPAEFQKLKSETEALWKPHFEQIAPKFRQYHKMVMDISWKCVENSRSSRSTLLRFLSEGRNFSYTEEYQKFAEVTPKDFDTDVFSIVLAIMRVANYYFWEWLAQAPIFQGRCLDSQFIESSSHNTFGVAFLSHFKIVSRESQANVYMNRIKSRFAASRSHPQLTLLAQLSNQIDKNRNGILSKRKDIERIKMNMIGEGSNDAGGPRREIFEEICDEIVNKLKLLVPTANNLDNVGDERDKFGPNGVSNSQYDEHLLYAFGMLLGTSMVSADCLPISLPTIFWKVLQYQEADWEDYPTFGFNQAQSLEYVEGLSKIDLDALESKLVFALGDGSSVELVPGGSTIRLCEKTRPLYIRKVRELLMGQVMAPILHIRKGFETMIGRGTTSLIATSMLERYVCGMDMVDSCLTSRSLFHS